MKPMKKPTASGPSPAQKATKALGRNLNRKAKEPPTFPGKKVSQNPAPRSRGGGQDSKAR